MTRDKNTQRREKQEGVLLWGETAKNRKEVSVRPHPSSVSSCGRLNRASRSSDTANDNVFCYVNYMNKAPPPQPPLHHQHTTLPATRRPGAGVIWGHSNTWCEVNWKAHLIRGPAEVMSDWKAFTLIYTPIKVIFLSSESSNELCSFSKILCRTTCSFIPVLHSMFIRWQCTASFCNICIKEINLSSNSSVLVNARGDGTRLWKLEMEKMTHK